MDLKKLLKKEGSTVAASRKIGVHRETFRKMFVKAYGMTPQKFMTKKLPEIEDEVTEKINITPIKIKAKKVKKSEEYNNEASLIISDAHVGKIVSEELFGLEYNTEVFKRRFEHMIQSAAYLLELTNKATKITKLHIILLGDLIDNAYMREGHGLRVDCGVAEQFKVMSDCLIGGINYLAEKYEVEVVSVPGNHSRITQKYNAAVPEDNIDHFIGYLLQKMFPELKVHIPRSWVSTYEIAGRNFLLTHGNVIQRGTSVGIPWSGLRKFLVNWSTILGSLNYKKLEGIITAHFHNPLFTSVYGKRIVMNGSFFALDEFGSTIATLGDPCQQLLIVNKDKGIIDCKPIWLMQEEG